MILNSPYITGSLTVTGNIITSGSITISGSIASASYAVSASEASKLQGLGSASFAPASTFNTVSQSYAASSASLSTRVTTNETNISTLTSASASFAVVSSSYAAASGSLSTRVTNLEVTSSTVSQSFASTSGSISGRVTLIEGQYATTGSNTFTGPQYVSQASNAISFTSTASLYTDGGLRVAKDSFVSGTAYFNNITVYGTSSIEYITSSQVNIGSNVITVNTDTPAIRFGGISVFDSGSTQLTGSLFWDSEKNHWIYSNPSGSSYNSAMLMNGPRNTGSLGDEQGTLNNYIMKGQGGDHITSSQITETGTATTFYSNALYVTASGNVALGLTSSAWVGATGLQVQYATVEGRSALPSFAEYTANSYSDSGTRKYITTDYASRYTQYQSNHYWFTAPSGTAGNAISFTQAMTLNASGNLSIGNTNDTFKLDVSGTARVSGGLTVTNASGVPASVTSTAATSTFVLDNTNANLWGGVYAVRVNGVDKNYFGTLGSLLGTSNTDATIWATAGNGFRVYTNGNNKQLEITTTGAATFSSDISARSGTIDSRVFKIYEASAARGGLYPYNLVLGSGTDYSVGIFSEGEIFMASGGTATKRLTIASTGAATFSSTINSGNIGINVSPSSSGSSKLDIYGATADSTLASTITIRGTNGEYNDSPFSSLDFYSINGYGSKVTARILARTGSPYATGGALSFWTTSGGNPAGTLTERFTISQSGAATFSSSVTAGGTINASDYIQAARSSGGYLMGISNTVDADLQFTLTASGAATKYASIGASGATNLVLVPNGGNVGINNTNPQTKLNVTAASATTSATLLTIDGGNTGFNNANDANTGYSINFDGCSYSTLSSIVQRTGAQIQMLKEGTWNEGQGAPGTYGSLVFKTNNGTIASPSLTERMRITSGGDIYAYASAYFTSTGAAPSALLSGVAIQNPRLVGPTLFSSGNVSDSRSFIQFINANGVVGSISTSGTATAFNTSSDYRLKQDLKDYNGLELISAIKTYDYEWKSDKTRTYGVLAHELQEVIPQAVFGEKDAEEMQGVDYSKIVPILVKAIQEQQAQIEALKARIETLEK